MVSRLNQSLNISIPLSSVFVSPTIRELARYAHFAHSETQNVRDENIVLLKQGKPHGKFLFLIHDGTGEVDGYSEFCTHLDDEFTCYGIRLDSGQNHYPQKLNVTHIAGEYIRKIGTIQKHGPFYIAGWSLGGTIAFEIARQLEEINETVEFIGLIDSPPPHENLRPDVLQFTPQAEIQFIRPYLRDKNLYDILQQARTIEQTWTEILDYMETQNLDVNILRQIITDIEGRPLPQYQSDSIRDTLKYMNIARSLSSARASYIPANKVKSPLRYFGAIQSGQVQWETWNRFCHEPLIFKSIVGDHYSIIKHPDVVAFASQFNDSLREASTTGTAKMK